MVLGLSGAPLFSASLTWTGGGADTHWSTAANWTPAQLPGTGDAILFNASSTKNSLVDLTYSATLASLQLASGYTGTLSLSSGLQFMVQGNATLSSGVLDLGSGQLSAGSLTVNSPASLLGGSGQIFVYSLSVGAATSFQAPTSGGGSFFVVSGNAQVLAGPGYSPGAGISFSGSNGATIMLQSQQDLGDISVSNSLLSLSGDVTAKSLSLVNGSSYGSLVLNTRTLTLSGDFNNGSGAGQVSLASGTLVLNGSASQAVTLAQGGPIVSLHSLQVAKPSGTASLLQGPVLFLNSATVSSGALDLGSSQLYAPSLAVSAGASLLGGSAQIYVYSLSVGSAASFQAPTSGNGTFFMVSGSAQVSGGPGYSPGAGILFGNNNWITITAQSQQDLGNVTVANSTLSLSGDLTAHNFSLFNGSTNGSLVMGSRTLTLNGDLYNPSGPISAASGTLLLNGSGTQNLQASYNTGQAVRFHSFQVSKPGGTLFIQPGQIISADSATFSQGTVDLSTSYFYPNNLVLSSGATFLAGSGQISVYNLSIGAGASFQAPTGGSAGSFFQVSGSAQISAGPGYSPGAGIFFGNSSWTTVTAQSLQDLGDVTVQGGALSLSGDLTAHNFSLSNGFGQSGTLILGSRTLTLNGDFYAGNGSVSGASGTLLFNGSGPESLSGPLSLTLLNLQVAKPSGTLSVQGGLLVIDTIAASLGTLDLGNSQSFLNNLVVSSGASLLGGNAQINVFNLSVPTGASFQAPSGSVAAMTVSGTAQIGVGPGYSPGNGMQFSNNGTVIMGLQSQQNVGDISISIGTLSLSGDVIAHSVNIAPGTLQLGSRTLTVSGSFTTSSGLSAASGTLIFSGTEPEILSGSGTFHSLQVAKSASFVRSSGSSIISADSVSVSQGTLDLSNSILVAGGLTVGSSGALLGGSSQINAYSLSVGPGASFQAPTNGGSFFQVSGSVQVSSGPGYSPGGGLTLGPSSGSMTLQSLQDLGDVTLSGTLNLSGDVSAHSLSMNGSSHLALGSWTLSLSGDFDNSFSGSIAGSTGTLLFNGSGSQSLKWMQSGVVPLLGQLLVSKSGGTLSLGTDLKASNLLLSQGSLDLGNNAVSATALTVGNGGSLQALSAALTVTSNCNLFSGSNAVMPSTGAAMQGNFQLVSGAAYVAGGPLRFQGTGTLATAFNPGTLVVAGGLSLSADSVLGNVSISAGGSLDLGGYNLSLGGTLLNLGRASLGNGALLLTGSNQSLLGSSSVQTLSKTVNFPDTLTFAGGQHQAVAATLDLEGSPGAMLSLRSTGGAAFLDVGASSVTLNYLDVQNSHASTVVLASHSTDSGGDVNWIFGTATPTVTATATQSPTQTPTPTATASATQTVTATPSPTGTPSPSATASATASATQSSTATLSASPTPSGTATPSASATPSATATGTLSATGTTTLTPTLSITTTRTFTPTCSPSSTVTPPATPAFAASGLGKPVLAPVPARKGQPVCLYFDAQPASSLWEVFGTDRQKVADLSFGSQYSQCWDTASVAPGVYLIRVNVTYRDGSKRAEMIKAMIVP